MYDHIMMEKLRTKDGSDKKEDVENAKVLYSDELECFNIFKERTGGVIYQNKRVQVNLLNKDFIAAHSPNFEVISCETKVPDKRKKEGTRTKITYTYKYFGEEFKTLKELNEHGVYISIPIQFDTLLDIIPYYSHIISICVSSGGKETVYISNKSYWEEMRDDVLTFGGDISRYQFYKKQLQNHYKDAVLRYLNPEGRRVVETISLDEDWIGHTTYPIDYNFDIKKEDNNPYWVSPKVIDCDKGMIYCHGASNKEIKISYVKKGEYKLYLD